MKLIIYKDYDVLEELQKILDRGYRGESWERGYKAIRDGINDLRAVIIKSVEITIENGNKTRKN